MKPYLRSRHRAFYSDDPRSRIPERRVIIVTECKTILAGNW